MDDDRIERRAAQIRAEQQRRQEERREEYRKIWEEAKEVCDAVLGEFHIEMPSREWMAKAKWTLRGELSRVLGEATSGKAEVAEPYAPEIIVCDGLVGDVGVWFYKEMLGRVVRAHVLNIGIHKARDGTSSHTIDLAPRITLGGAITSQLNLAGVLHVATEATIEAMAQSVAAGCHLLAPKEVLSGNKR